MSPARSLPKGMNAKRAISLAIGIAVLYKRKTAPIAWAFLGAYAVIALAIAGVMAALG